MKESIGVCKLICLLVTLSFAGVSEAAVFKSIQSGTHTHTTINGTQTTSLALTTAVDPGKTYLIFQSSHSSADPGGSMIRGRILDANTLEFESVYDRSSTINIQWYLVEYSSGVKVQRGAVSQSASTTNVTLPTNIAAVNQAFVTWSKTPLGSDSSWSSDDPILGEITSTSNLQFRANQANANHIIWWQVVEYTDAADISVQTITTSMTGSRTNRTVGISSVDTSKSFILSGFRTSGSGNDIDERMISTTFSNSTNVRIRRNGSGDDLTEVVLQVVELNDGTAVQGGETRIRNGDTSATDSISAITPANSIAFGSVQAVGGQNMGRVDYDSNDIVGEGSARLSLNATQLTLNRDRSADDAYIGWFVLDFSAVPIGVPPEISTIGGSCAALATITIVYSEDVEQTSAETIGNYTVTNPSGGLIGINSATRSASNTVTLALAATLNDLTEYTVSISNVQDLDGDTIVAASTDSFSLSCSLNCISDNFAGPGPLSAEWSVGNSSGSFGNPRVVTNGRAQLTNASGNVATVATLLNQFPGADNKIEIEFDYYAYSGTGADGIAVTFSDASIPPVPGSYGGALGYAQRTGGSSGPGFAGGWLGIGIDEFGNFANGNEGKSGGSGFERDSVALRGSGSGNTGYPYLTSTGTLSPGIDQSGSTPNPGHRYKITIDHTMGGSEAWTKVERDSGAGFIEIIPNFDIFAVNPFQAAVPANWVVSFTGSTGGSTNIHEIADLQVCAARPISSYGSPDHYAISHSTPGVTCEGSQVTVTAHDASHNAYNVSSNTDITVTTSPAVSSIISSPATIPAGASSTSFYLNQTSALANIDIDVTDGTATDPDDAGSEDPAISFLDTAFRFYADGDNTDTTPIGTQIAGKPSSTAPGSQALTLRAIRTNTDTGACEAALTGSQSVDIAYECNNPTTCVGSNLLELTGTGPGSTTITRNNNGSALSYAPVNMTFDANGEAPFLFEYSDAGQISLHAQKSVAASSPDPAFTLTGSSNRFITRPFGFDLDFANARAADWLDGGTLDGSAGNSSYALDDSGSAYIASGTNVSMQVTAVNWESADDSNNDGVPDAGSDLTDNAATSNFGQESSSSAVTIGHSLNLPATVYTGALNSSTVTAGGGSSSFTNGVASTTVSWSEVGIIDINASLQNYLADANADISGAAPNVGRFYPDHFDVTANSGSFADACGSFSYIGQSIGYATVPSLDIVAKNAAGGTTQNYTHADFQKLLATNISRAFPAADNSEFGEDASTLMVVTPSVNPGTLSVGASAGELVYDFDANDGYLYDKDGNSEIGPFTSSLTIATTGIADSDGATASALPSVSPAATASGIRYGRWNMLNAFGPETDDLTMPARAEYLNARLGAGGKYVANTADNCSNLSGTVSTSPAGTGTGPITSIAVGSGSSDLSFSNTLSSGDGQFLFSFPGSGNTGSIDVDVDLSALLWLQYDWNGDGSLQDHPGATATFGQYRGHDRIIYWREVAN